MSAEEDEGEDEFMVTADQMKARLESYALPGRLVPALKDVAVEVDKQKDVAALVAKLVGKAGGNLVIILFEGFSVPDENTPGPRVLARYSIGTWSHPIINAPGSPTVKKVATKIVRSVCKALHQWVPDGGHNFGEMIVKGGDLVPDTAWLRYQASVTVMITL